MSTASGVHVTRHHCRDCRFWFLVNDWQGNCRRHPWPKPRWSETATAHCHDFMHRLAHLSPRKYD